MILSNIENAELYYSINPLIKIGIEFLLSHLDAEPGRYEIVGEECFLIVAQGTKRPKREAKLEVHNTYIDIQVILKGSENFGYKARTECVEPSGEFDTTKDIGFYQDAPSTYINARPGDMLIFLPQDGHAPLVGKGSVRKAILKIRYR